jgi:Right handed beta helix region
MPTPGAPEVSVNPGDDLNQMVERHSPGTEFHLQAGVYRLQSITPRDGDVFIGESGAILNGSQLLRDFTRSGGMWTARVQVTRLGEYRGKCFPSHPACTFSEDLFSNNAPLLRVADKRDVGRGKWYLDYDAHKIYLGDDPEGHTIEISLMPYAIRGAASNVRIEGLTIEKYACPAGSGAVDGRGESGQLSYSWVVQKNVIRLNHGLGIRTGDGMQVTGNKLVQNGQMGIGGGGDKVMVDGNEIARNNYAGYNYGWEAGGSKFTFTHNLVVRNNDVHNNDGPGLWTDLENENTLYENNHTTSNREAGILEEVSYHATIRNNTIENDGFSDSGQTEPWYGGGILISDSSDVSVYGNTVADCMNGIVGLQHQRGLSRKGSPYLVENLNVHDNTISQKHGIAAGILRSGTLGDEVFLSRNNRFTNNQFHLANPQAKSFTWKEARLTLEDWKRIWQ